jgi:hypothetical protein
MTRDEAIRNQIDQCLDDFNAEECAKVCAFLWKRGDRHFPEDWHDGEGTFFYQELRRTARQALMGAVSCTAPITWDQRSYLLATKIEGVDESDGQPFIRLGLHFDITMADTHDGTSYEAQPPKAQD